jgi:hypothetical protein
VINLLRVLLFTLVALYASALARAWEITWIRPQDVEALTIPPQSRTQESADESGPIDRNRNRGAGSATGPNVSVESKKRRRRFVEEGGVQSEPRRGQDAEAACNN